MDVFDLCAKISLDASEYDKELDNASKKTSMFGDVLKATLTADAIIGGIKKIAGGIANITQASFQGYAEYEQLVGGVETLFKDSASTVQKYAENAYKTAGLTANEYMSTATSFSASLLQGLGGDTERAAQITDMAITDMADNMNKMGTSMESIQHAYMGFSKQNYTMLDNLKLGYGGTKTEMERLLADAQKLTGVNYNISNLADVYSAIHAIQEEIGITGTTALEAEKTLQGSLASMKSAWQNLIVGIADSNANLDDLVQRVITTGEAALSNIIPFATRTLNGMVKLVTKAIPSAIRVLYESIKNAVPGYLERGREAINSFIEGFIYSIPDALQATGDFISKLVSFVATNLPKVFQARGELRKTIVTAIINVLPAALSALKSAITQIGQTIVSEGPKLVNYAMETFNNLVTSIRDNVPVIIGTVKTVIPQVIEAAQTLIPQIITRASEIFAEVKQTITSNLPVIISAVQSVLAEVVAFFRDKISTITSVAGEVLGMVVQFVSENIHVIVDAVKLVIPKIVEFFTNNLPELIDAGLQIVKGIAEGIWNNIEPIVDAVISVVGRIAGFIADHATELFQAGLEIVTKIATAIWDNRNEIAYKLGEIIGDLINLIAPYIPQIFAVGAWILGKIITGIVDHLPEVLDVAGQFVEYFAKGLGDAVPALQPLTDIIAFLGENLETLGPIVLGAFGAFKIVNTVTPMVSGLADIFGKFSGVISKLPSLLTMLTSPIGIAVAAIAAFAAGFVYLYQTNDEFAAHVNEKWEEIKNKLIEIWEKLKPTFEKIGETFKNLMETLEPLFTLFFDTVISKIEMVLDVLEPAIETLGNVFAYAMDIFGAIIALLTGDFDGALEHVKSAMGHFADAWGSLMETAKAAVKAFLMQFGIDTDEIGRKLSSFCSNVKNKWNSLRSDTSTKWNAMKESMSGAARNAWSAVTEWFGKMYSSISSKAGEIKDAITEKIGGAIQWIIDLPGKAWQWGHDLISNFVSGIREKLGSAGDAAEWVAEKIAGFLHFSEPDEGPLAHFSEFAPDMMKLFAEGIKNNTKLVTDQIEKSFDFGDMITGQSINGQGYSAGATITNYITIDAHGASSNQDWQQVADIVSERISYNTNRRLVAMGAI